MDLQRWRQVEALYEAARKDRAVLDQAGPELRRQVEARLAQDSGTALLDRPAREAAPELAAPTTETQTMLGPGAHGGFRHRPPQPLPSLLLPAPA